MDTFGKMNFTVKIYLLMPAFFTASHRQSSKTAFCLNWSLLQLARFIELNYVKAVEKMRQKNSEFCGHFFRFCREQRSFLDKNL